MRDKGEGEWKQRIISNENHALKGNYGGDYWLMELMTMTSLGIFTFSLSFWESCSSKELLDWAKQKRSWLFPLRTPISQGRKEDDIFPQTPIPDMAKDNNGENHPQKEPGAIKNKEQGNHWQGVESEFNEEIFLIHQDDIRSSE